MGSGGGLRPTTAIVHHTHLPLEVSAGKETNENPGGPVPRPGEVITQHRPEGVKTGLECTCDSPPRSLLRTEALISPASRSGDGNQCLEAPRQRELPHTGLRPPTRDSPHLMPVCCWVWKLRALASVQPTEGDTPASKHPVRLAEASVITVPKVNSSPQPRPHSLRYGSPTLCIPP